MTPNDALAQRRSAFLVRPTPLGAISAAVGLLVAFVLLYPLGKILSSLFIIDGAVDLSGFSEVARMPGLPGVLLNTIICVTVGGTGAMLIGSVVAWINERTDARMGAISSIMPVLPILVPPVAVAIGWVFLLSPRSGTLNVALRHLTGSTATEGPLNIFSWPGMLFLYSLELTPFVYLLVSAALRNLDPSLEQASRMSGAGPFSTLRRVTLPAIKPALASSALMLITIGLALFSIPAIIGTTAGIEVISTRIVELLHGTFPSRTAEAVVLSFGVLVVIAAAWFAQARVVRSRRFASIGGKGVSLSQVDLGRWRLPVRILLCAFVAVGTILPFLGLLLVSVQSYWSANIQWDSLGFQAYRDVWFQNLQTRSAITNSVILGLITGTVGMAIAWLLALQNRQDPSRFSRTLDGLVKLPAGLSHIVIAVGLLIAFAGPPFKLSGTLVILLTAYVIMYLPQGSIAAASAVGQVGSQLTEASRTSGAGEWRTARRISLPLMLPGIMGGWALLFVFAMGDLTASVLLAGPGNPTVGFVLYDLYSHGTYPQIAALAMIMSVASSVVVLTMLRLTSGNIGARPGRTTRALDQSGSSQLRV